MANDTEQDLINRKAQELREKEKMDEKLDVVMKSASIYPDVIKSLSGLRKSVEVLVRTITEVEERQDTHIDNCVQSDADLDHVFEKVREISKNIEDLENKLVDKNNAGSLIEVISNLIGAQNKMMTDQNNPGSVLSVLKKSTNLQSRITWLLMTVVTIITMVDRFFM